MTEQAPEAGQQREALEPTPVSLDMPRDQLELLTGLAILDETTLADQIREAVKDYTNHRKSDPTLPDQMRAYAQRR